MTFDNADDFLQNWARWLRGGVKKEPNDTCGSAEGMYRSKKDDEERARVSISPSIPEAEIAEHIVNNKLPKMMRDMLVCVMVQGRGYVAKNDVVLDRLLKKRGSSIRICEQEQYFENAKVQLFMYYKSIKNEKVI